MAKMAAERRPIDDMTPTTDVKLKSAPANLGMMMDARASAQEAFEFGRGVGFVEGIRRLARSPQIAMRKQIVAQRGKLRPVICVVNEAKNVPTITPR